MKHNNSFKSMILILMMFFVSMPHLWAQGTGTNENESYDGNGTFVLINSIEDLTDGYYVIAANPEFGDWAMSSTMSDNNAFLTRTAISPVDETIVNPDAAIVWKIETNVGGKVIYSENSGKYISYTGSSNNVQVVDEVTADNQRWTITYGNDADEENIFIFNNLSVTNRILQYNSNVNQERFACYSTNQKKLALYKLEEETTPIVPIVTSETFNGEVNLAASFQIQATESPEIFTLVSGTLPAGLTLDTTNGLISGSPTEAGNSSIVVTATNDEGTSEEATINFVIAKAAQTMTPELEDITKNENEAPFTLPSNTDQGIEINYLSSDVNVATISGNTVTIIGIGETNISATNNGNDNYEAFSDSFILFVGELGIGDFDLNAIHIYTQNQNIILDSKTEKILSVELFDLSGRQIHFNNKVNSNHYQFHADKGIVIVKLQTNDGKIITKKLINH